VRFFYQFLKSTLIGGLLVLVPLALVGAIVVNVVLVVYEAILPALGWLRFDSAESAALAGLLTCLSVVGVCFFAGLFAETTLMRRLIERAERLVLAHIPGYALMKNVGENLVGVQAKDVRQTVLVHSQGHEQIGFLMDTLADGRKVVFIPGVPRALVGTLHIFPADCVQELNLSIASTLDALGKLGVGLHEHWPADKPVAAP
jgi:uncharacterized membrane protein